MVAKKKAGKPKAEPTARQLEIERIRKVPRGERSEGEKSRLSALLAEERRDRFVRLNVPRVKKARVALRNVARLGDANQYHYEEEEAKALVKILKDDIAEIERVFTGAVKEKGIYDV